jgi:hypothetical protein
MLLGAHEIFKMCHELCDPAWLLSSGSSTHLPGPCPYRGWGCARGSRIRLRCPCSYRPRPSRWDSHRAPAVPSGTPSIGRSRWRPPLPWTWPGMGPVARPPSGLRPLWPAIRPDRRYTCPSSCYCRCKCCCSIVEIPRAVNQIPTTGQAARKKCRERELLKEAYWKIRRPK